jgi:hypothetical protein
VSPVSSEALMAIIKNEFYEFDALLHEKGESETVTSEGIAGTTRGRFGNFHGVTVASRGESVRTRSNSRN